MGALRRFRRRLVAAVSPRIASASRWIAAGARSITSRKRSIASEIVEIIGLSIVAFAAFEVHRIAGLFTLGALVYLYGVSMDPPTKTEAP